MRFCFQNTFETPSKPLLHHLGSACESRPSICHSQALDFIKDSKVFCQIKSRASHSSGASPEWTGGRPHAQLCQSCMSGRPVTLHGADTGTCSRASLRICSLRCGALSICPRLGVVAICNPFPTEFPLSIFLIDNTDHYTNK